jgi:hypothetical protein
MACAHRIVGDPISAEALQLLTNKCWSTSTAPVPLVLFPSWPLAYPRTPIYSPVWIWPFSCQTEYNSLHTKLPVSWLACTGSWESRSLRDIRRSQSSSARVKTDDHVFGECLRHDYSLSLLYCSWLEHCAAGGSEDRHCILSALHRVGRLHRQALCRLAPASMPLGIIYLHCFLVYILSTYSHTMLDQILSWILPLVCFYF